jgi:hypothetical protein
MIGRHFGCRGVLSNFDAKDSHAYNKVRNCHAIGEKPPLVFISTRYFCAPLEDVVGGLMPQLRAVT